MVRRTQREFMRELYRRFGGDRAAVVQRYAAAERDGIVDRKRNVNQQTPEQYAEALFADGIAKGWLDTHAVASRPAQAEALADTLAVVEQGEPVTFDQFNAGLAEMHTEIAEVRKEIASLNTRFSTQISAAETRLTWRMLGIAGFIIVTLRLLD